MMFLKRKKSLDDENIAKGTPWADRLRLHGSYYDDAEGREIFYRVRNTRIGLGLMYIAGVVSGLLGIGSGALKVPAMDLAMHLPIKVSTATSNFMIGVTAAATAAVYFMRGDINPTIAAPVASGVLLGAILGSRLLGPPAEFLDPRGFCDRVDLGIGADAVKGIWHMTASLNHQSPPNVPESDKRSLRVELIISNLLRIGVLTSLTVVIIGVFLTFLRQPGLLTSTTDVQQLTQPGGANPFTWQEFSAGVRGMQGEAIVMLGLLLLIATPIGRVAVSILAFVYQKDRVYTLITLAVFCLLLLSFVLGKVE